MNYNKFTRVNDLFINTEQIVDIWCTENSVKITMTDGQEFVFDTKSLSESFTHAERICVGGRTVNIGD